MSLIVLAVATSACQQRREPARVETAVSVQAPDQTAYHRALRVPLPAQEGEDGFGLLNVHRLSEDIISGSEPEGEAGFRRMAALGVKTVLSVDGKAPDVSTAGRFGMRYVHVPIQYRGITESELLRISKTFLELEGPFYVHCFHGRHRGPAAAAVGRVLLDGVSRDRALAEMRQWCGTSGKYEGLYQVVASRALPTERACESLEWDFPARVKFDGLRLAMVESTRIYDHLKKLEVGGWVVDPEHPDLDPEHEAGRLAELLSRLTEDASEDVAPMREGFLENIEQARELRSLMASFKGGDQASAARASAVLKDIKQSCNACHRAYRN